MKYGEQPGDISLDGMELMTDLGRFDQSAADLVDSCRDFYLKPNGNNRDDLETSVVVTLQSFNRLAETTRLHIPDPSARLEMLGALILVQDDERVSRLQEVSGSSISSLRERYNDEFDEKLRDIALQVSDEESLESLMSDVLYDSLQTEMEQFTHTATERHNHRPRITERCAKAIGNYLLKGTQAMGGSPPRIRLKHWHPF